MMLTPRLTSDTRAACDLIASGTVQSYPRVKTILSHAGGTLPYLALRPAAALPYIPTELPSVYQHMTSSKLAQSFYFDTALSATRPQLRLLS